MECRDKPGILIKAHRKAVFFLPNMGYNTPMEKDLFGELLDIMRRLRGEGGCPWDREQTFESIKPMLIEECYEVIEAIEEGDLKKLPEELGDLLYQIIFLAQIGQEEGIFDMSQVLSTIAQKMVRRHPHVFSDDSVRDVSDVLIKWEEIKRKEKKEKGGDSFHSVLDGIPNALPTMIKAHRVQTKAARVGFDWARVEEVIEKLREEVDEFQGAIDEQDNAHIESEYGDLLFTMVNIGRFLGVDPESSLKKAIKRFCDRFSIMERLAVSKGLSLNEIGFDEMDNLWEAAKTEIP